MTYTNNLKKNSVVYQYIRNTCTSKEIDTMQVYFRLLKSIQTVELDVANLFFQMLILNYSRL